MTTDEDHTNVEVIVGLICKYQIQCLNNFVMDIFFCLMAEICNLIIFYIDVDIGIGDCFLEIFAFVIDGKESSPSLAIHIVCFVGLCTDELLDLLGLLFHYYY